MNAGPGVKRWILIGGLAVLVVSLTAAFLLWGRTARGTLVSSTSGRPIAGAMLRTVAGVVKTDASGHFEIAGLRLGSQPVIVTAPGFAPFETAIRPAWLGATEGDLELPDARAAIRVEELAVERRERMPYKVTIQGVTASRNASGTYEAKGLKPGKTTLIVTDPSHEPARLPVTLKPGANAVTAKVTLTAWETYSRYFEAYKSDRWTVAYAYLHPDIRKRESLAVYTKDMKAWGKPQATSFQSQKALQTWRSPKTGISYTDVVELHRTLVTNKQGMHYVTAVPQHWAKVLGVWMRVDL